jgi:hypothetical protein
MMDADLAYYRGKYQQTVFANTTIKGVLTPTLSFESWLALRCRAAETRVEQLEQLEQALEPVVAILNSWWGRGR